MNDSLIRNKLHQLFITDTKHLLPWCLFTPCSDSSLWYRRRQNLSYILPLTPTSVFTSGSCCSLWQGQVLTLDNVFPRLSLPNLKFLAAKTCWGYIAYFIFQPPSGNIRHFQPLTPNIFTAINSFFYIISGITLKHIFLKVLMLIKMELYFHHLQVQHQLHKLSSCFLKNLVSTRS